MPNAGSLVTSPQSCLDPIFITAGSPVVHCASGVAGKSIFSDPSLVFAAICLGNNDVTPSISSVQLPTPRRMFSFMNFLKIFLGVPNEKFGSLMSPGNAPDAFHVF